MNDSDEFDFDDLSWEEIKSTLIAYMKMSEWLEETLFRCEDALHDTLLRAANVLPESAEEFYDPELAEQAQVRRTITQLKQERGMN